ncbi:MAG: hypothetical protein Q8N10_01125 [Phenylobacterium sp.]|uniref:hypothetical protein n=1 Tax=Phenylobacterium sp. TaxID=1871053 RepID=UPI002716FC2C|nr:hypothetical protein [Phenylobacterium sp.]MDO8911379.1 hypothetical protein [Phenylobacterium sp.]MDP3099082.1 hypothetical protein [Phenylobacterium sp.]
MGAGAVGAVAFGAFAVGALALGVLSIGYLAVGGLALGRGHIKHLEIDDLVVRKLTIVDGKPGDPT